jgi:hypothetical protein
MVHRSQLVAVHRPSATVVQHDCGHHTAQGETRQASVPRPNAGSQPELPENAVFQEMSRVWTILGAAGSRFFVPQVREPKFLTLGIPIPGNFGFPGFGASGFDSGWMTDIYREESKHANVQDFGDTGGVSAAGSQQKEQA